MSFGAALLMVAPIFIASVTTAAGLYAHGWKQRCAWAAAMVMAFCLLAATR